LQKRVTERLKAAWPRPEHRLPRVATRNPRLVLLAVGAVLIGAVAVTAWVTISSSRQHTMDEANRRFAQLSFTIAEQTARAMQSVDLILLDLGDRFAAEGVTTEAAFREHLASRAVNDILREKARDVPQINTLLIQDASGELINNGRLAWPVTPISSADRDYFVAVRDHPEARPFISEPTVSRITGERVLFLARRFSGPNGEFLGLIGAAIDVKYLENFYRTASPGDDDGTVSLYRDDGILLARYPTDQYIGRSFASQAFFAAARGQENPGTLLALGLFAGELRVMAPHEVRGYPLVVNIAVNQVAILGAWRHQAYVIVAIAAMAAILIALLGLLVGRLFAVQGQLVLSIEEQEKAYRARAVAEAASHAKSSFLANMSHELRTPLNAIIGFTEMLEARLIGQLTDRQADYVHDIGASGHHLLEVINGILDMSKIEAGTYELTDDTFDVGALLDEALAFLRLRAEKKGIVLRKAVAPGLPMLRADRRALLQVVLNLVSNAVSFTEKGGSVTVSVSVAAGGEVEIVAADTGVGIDPEHLPHIFEPFQRIDAHRSRKHGGSGLGLSISKLIVEHHGGQVTIASRPGVGTTVTIRLPADRLAGRKPSAPYALRA
jgi:signal transduction histidine kinase